MKEETIKRKNLKTVKQIQWNNTCIYIYIVNKEAYITKLYDILILKKKELMYVCDRDKQGDNYSENEENTRINVHEDK